jgi:hypothetical protein
MSQIPPFKPGTVEGIAKTLGDTNEGLSGSEIGGLLRQCDIGDPLPSYGKSPRLLEALSQHQKKTGSSQGIIEFIKAAMDPARYTEAPSKLRDLRRRLNTVLLLCGLELTENGRLMQCDAAATLSEAQERVSHPMREPVSEAVDEAPSGTPLDRGEAGVIRTLGFPLAPSELEPRASGVFVAHPYSNFTVDDFRETLTKTLGQQDLQPEYADEVITAEHILHKICRQIQETRFGIYDLTNWNANVTLELGIAMALSRPMLLLIDIRTDTEPPADLQGLGRVPYSSMTDLAKKLDRDLPGFLDTLCI